MATKPFSKFFSKLENQLLGLLLLSTIVPVSIVGWYGISSSTTVLSNSAITELEEEVADKAGKIRKFLQGINEDVLFLSKVPSIQGIIQARAAGGVDKQGNSSYDLWVKQLNTIFAGMMEAKPYYYMQLRYLNENGHEMVRVDSDGTNIKVIPKAKLQNKANKSYFTKTMKLRAGEIYQTRAGTQQLNEAAVELKQMI
ncbi:MAG: hypothetical protein AB4426_15410 [Xenococcaceae cyanobacterium]